MATQKIVTKETLTALVTGPRAIEVIGRALVVIFNNQTAIEKQANVTDCNNGIGFTGADAHGGCITAKYFLRHGTLLDWQIESWSKRIVKYHRQLNDAAEAKAAAKLAA